MICTDARCVPLSLSGRETPHLCPDRAAWRPLEELGVPLTPGGGDPQAREPATSPAGGARAPRSEVKDTPPFAAFSTPHPPGTRPFEDALGVDGQRDRRPDGAPPPRMPPLACASAPQPSPAAGGVPRRVCRLAPCFMPPQPRPGSFSCASAAPSPPRGAGRERESCLGYETRRAAWPRSSHRAALGQLV